MKKYDQEIVCLHIQKLKQELNDVLKQKLDTVSYSEE
jgi:hypothetical protein